MSRRHPGLVPVARDHVHALSMAARLRRGARRGDERWPSDPAEQAARLQHFLASELQPHFAVEEALVFPLASEHLVEGAALVSLLVEEHRAIERMILAFTDAVPDAPTLAALGALLEAHVRREDRTLFPRMESEVPAASLAALEAATVAWRASSWSADPG